MKLRKCGCESCRVYQRRVAYNFSGASHNLFLHVVPTVCIFISIQLILIICHNYIFGRFSPIVPPNKKCRCCKLDQTHRVGWKNIVTIATCSYWQYWRLRVSISTVSIGKTIDDSKSQEYKIFKISTSQDLKILSDFITKIWYWNLNRK